MKTIYLETSTFRGGMCCDAIHYYGRLSWKNNDGVREDLEIQKKLSREEAHRLTEHDGYEYKWRAGNTTGRFEKEEEIIELAMKEYKKIFPDCDCILVKGRYNTCEPQEILCGPEEYAKQVNELYAEAERIGFWDNDKRMTQIENRWIILNKEYGVE